MCSFDGENCKRMLNELGRDCVSAVVKDATIRARIECEKRETCRKNLIDRSLG